MLPLHSIQTSVKRLFSIPEVDVFNNIANPELLGVWFIHFNPSEHLLYGCEIINQSRLEVHMSFLWKGCYEYKSYFNGHFCQGRTWLFGKQLKSWSGALQPPCRQKQRSSSSKPNIWLGLFVLCFFHLFILKSISCFYIMQVKIGYCLFLTQFILCDYWGLLSSKSCLNTFNFLIYLWL